MTVTPDIHSQILDNLPHVVMRLNYVEPKWNASYVNRAVERYGYTRKEFESGMMTWNDLLHPDDRVVALKQSKDYMDKGIDDFKLQYRLITKNGASIYITEHSHVNRNPDGSRGSIDSFLFENLKTGSQGGDEIARRNGALNDILLTLLDANNDPEKAIQLILDRAGAFLDCSRALLFKDGPGHKTCKVVYEWLNHGITSIKDLDYAVTYDTEMPEIYVALQDSGVLLVNAGEIPENCKEEFEAEGLISSAIFAVYQYGDHYGFVCFDDCVVERRWDADTADFLKVVANLLSNIVMHLQSVDNRLEYENTIKSLAFRDYLTGLPNRYPFDSDFTDVVFAAGEAKTPGYAVMIEINGLDAVRSAHGFLKASDLCKVISDTLQPYLRETLGERGMLYRIGGTVFAVLAQPGPAEPVMAFTKKASDRGRAPWRTEAGEFACYLSVSALPFGVKNTDLEKIVARLDAANVESCQKPEHPVVFLADEE